jgi:ABC-2 type transport system permease protein
VKVHNLRHYGRAVVAAFEMTLRQNVLEAFILFTALVQPLIIALLALWMLRERGGDYAIFVVVGSGMTGLWSIVLFIGGNSINWERWTGTLEMLVGLPTPMLAIVFGKNLANVAQSLSSMVASYFLASLLFGYPLQVKQPLLFVISLAFTVVAFVSFGLIIAPVFVMNPGVQGWQNAMEFPVYILSGFLFPIALLPGWTTPLSYLLAPYWAARVLHATSSGGASLAEVAFCWAMMLLFSLIYLFISSRLFQLMIRKARADATLGMQ